MDILDDTGVSKLSAKVWVTLYFKVSLLQRNYIFRYGVTYLLYCIIYCYYYGKYM